MGSRKVVTAFLAVVVAVVGAVAVAHGSDAAKRPKPRHLLTDTVFVNNVGAVKLIGPLPANATVTTTAMTFASFNPGTTTGAVEAFTTDSSVDCTDHVNSTE